LVAGARGDGITGLGGRRAAVERATCRSGPRRVGSTGNRGGRARVSTGASSSASGALVAGARCNGITGLGGRRAAVERATGRSSPSTVGLTCAARGRAGVAGGAGNGTRGAVVGRPRSNCVSSLGRGLSTVTVRARVGAWGGRVDVITCRTRASVTCAGRGHVNASTRGVRSGAAATRGRVSGAAFFVHAHQIGGNIAGVAVASKASAGSSYIDARAVAAAGMARTAVDVGAGTLVVKVTHGTFTSIAIQRSSIINTHTISTSVVNTTISVSADAYRVCREAHLATDAWSADRHLHATKLRARGSGRVGEDNPVC